MFKLSWLILFLAISATFVVVKAEEEDEDIVVEDEEVEADGDADVSEDMIEEEYEEEEEWDGTFGPSEDLQTFAYFPDYPDKKLPIGKEITLLFSVTNTGMETYNLSFASAALHSPYDYDYYIQNFTMKPMAEYLTPNAQFTVEYKFKCEEKLEPLDYWFSGSVWVNGTRRIYKETPINGTVSLVQEQGDFGFKELVVYLISMGVIGGTGYGILLSLKGKKKTKKVETGTRKASPDDLADSWDMPTHVQKASRQRKKPKKKAN